MGLPAAWKRRLLVPVSGPAAPLLSIRDLLRITRHPGMSRRSLPPQVRSRGVTAVLGPTNTGKTHLAIERMLGHDSGMIGLPLRLLAREVYDRITERIGEGSVALVMGEEKRVPKRPRYWIYTVEAMPMDLEVDFVAIDE